MADRLRMSASEFAAAEERGRHELRTQPRAIAARYDDRMDRIVVELASGCTLLVPPRVLQDIQDATPDQIAEIDLSPTGLALHWPRIDVDFTVAGLVAGVFGTAAFMRLQRGEEKAREGADVATAQGHAPSGGIAARRRERG